ncbi:MAG: DUF2062 domain-containing protein [Kiritimatiellae bacterium]|nr:DUF2062 domain-containing protein [Kiritimatiellia bacterium]
MKTDATAPPRTPRRGPRERVLIPIKRLVTQGTSPSQIALCIVLGAGIALFPIVGTTTLICTAVAILLHLNLPAIQAVNWLFAGAQLVMILPFMRIGEWLYGATPLPLSSREIAAMFRSGVWDALATLGKSVGHAVSGWAAVCVPIGILAYLVLVRVFRRHSNRRFTQRVSGPTSGKRSNNTLASQ